MPLLVANRLTCVHAKRLTIGWGVCIVEIDLFRRLTEPAAARAARTRARAELEAAMASAALVANADGESGLAQRLLLDRILDSVESLHGSDPHIAVEIFEEFCTVLRDNPSDGRGRALSAIAAFAGAPDTSRLLLHIAGAMADSWVSDSGNAEAEIANIAKVLGLPGEVAALSEARPAAEAASAPTVIVLGNAKGGTGKSTTALHLAAALMSRGQSVGTIDLDGQQGTLSRYVANRSRAAEESGGTLPMMRHRRIEPSDLRDRTTAEAEERAALKDALTTLAACHYVVIDTPGNHSCLSRLGHEQADILITPLNDSFLDVDVLALIDRERREVMEPSLYGRMVLDESTRRAEQGRPAIDWIVMRNRLAHIDARNTREMETLLRQLGERMGFRLHAGISERVVYRELFYKGLTLLDLPLEPGGRVSSGRLHAQSEIDDLVEALHLSEASVAA